MSLYIPPPPLQPSPTTFPIEYTVTSVTAFLRDGKPVYSVTVNVSKGNGQDHETTFSVEEGQFSQLRLGQKFRMQLYSGAHAKIADLMRGITATGAAGGPERY
jgi:hypothetical protein